MQLVTVREGLCEKVFLKSRNFDFLHCLKASFILVNHLKTHFGLNSVKI